MAGSREGYYEIRNRRVYGKELKATAFAGNLLFNGLHWHSSLELLFCLKGKIRVRLEGNVLEMEEGDLLTIDSGMSHEIFDGIPGGLQIIASIDAPALHRGEDERYELATVGKYARSREDEEILSVGQSLRRMTWLLTPDKNEAERFSKQFSQRFLKKMQDGQHPESLQGFRSEEEWNWFHREMYNVLWHLSRNKRKINGADDLHAGEPQKSLEKCLEILNRDFAEELSAAVIAEKTGVSEPTVYRMFKKQIGVSFSNYLNMVRINAACGYLESTDWEIMEVAEKSGFTSLSNFYRVFLQQRGMSPRAWQREKVRHPGRKIPVGQDIMGLNRFENFYELPYERDFLLG